MISKDNLTQYIDFLHRKRNGTPASNELLLHWSNIDPNSVQFELNNLYTFWQLDPQQVKIYEAEFISIFRPQPIQNNSPVQQSFQHQYDQPNKSASSAYYNPSDVQAGRHSNMQHFPETGHKKKMWPSIIIVSLLVIAIPVIGYLLMDKFSNDNSSPVVKNNNAKTISTPPPQKVEVQQQKIEPTEVIEEEDNKNKIDAINGLLNAEESRDFDKIMRYFSPKIEKYWGETNPTQDKMLSLYQETWAKAVNIKYDNILVKRISNTVYEMNADYSFYSIKDDTVKSVKVKNVYEFDKNGKISKAYSK